MKIVTAEFIKSAVNVKDSPAGEFPEIALAGRSNVGKSSFLNKMVNRKGLARTSNTPGRTRMINFFMVNSGLYIVDLPGYGYARVPGKMKLDWGKNIREYLEKSKNLAVVVQLLDIRHSPTEMDLNLYFWLKEAGIPVIPVATKADKLSKNQANNRSRMIRQALDLEDGSPLVLFSSRTGQGRDEVWGLIEAVITQKGVGI